MAGVNAAGLESMVRVFTREPDGFIQAGTMISKGEIGAYKNLADKVPGMSRQSHVFLDPQATSSEATKAFELATTAHAENQAKSVIQTHLPFEYRIGTPPEGVAKELDCFA